MTNFEFTGQARGKVLRPYYRCEPCGLAWLVSTVPSDQRCLECGRPLAETLIEVD